MKFKGLILRLALITAVLISLIATWYIWFNPSHLERRATTNVAVKSAAVGSDHRETNVFLPTMVYRQHHDNKRLLTRESGRMSAHLHKAMAKWRVASVGKAEKYTEADYENLITRDDSVQMVYESPITWSLFNKYFFTRPAETKSASFDFNRIVVDMKHHGFWLTNDATRRVRKLKLTKAVKFDAFAKALTETSNQYPVTEVRLDNREVASFTAPINVDAYSFLMDSQGANHYVTRLMATERNTPAAVDAKQIGDQTVYTVNNNNRRLAVDRNDNQMRYENFATSGPFASHAKNIDAAYADVLRLGIKQMRGMSFYGYDHKLQAATFRMTVAGLPIIGQKMRGAVVVTHTNASKQIEFSSDNLSVAIPTSTRKTRLPATSGVYTALAHVGITADRITDIVLAYAWDQAVDNVQVAELTPTYFVQIDGTYYDYTTLASGDTKLPVEHQDAG